MPFTTFGVATAVTPSVIETYFSHYLNRKPLKQKPTAHISYHEGLRLIRQFLDYSSKHSVEDLQAFTAQWVPVPTWVRTQDIEVPPQFLRRSANVLRKQLGNHGIDKVGGEKWWEWRRPESALHAEWIEMKKDHNERKREGRPCDRVILYVHGGAYYFGSVDEHRYQMQRHARKLKARVLSPRYRLAPQFPFPCGLYDCIATYFYLLEHFEPNQILFAGDSAGGGMVLSMLVTLRDQGCPLPAGTILLSPWVDLTHSFPSVAGDGAGDYIPPHGFHHKPSMAWPPPPITDEELKTPDRKFTQPVEQPFDVVELPATYIAGMGSKASRDNLRSEAQAIAEGQEARRRNNQIPGMGPRLEIAIDDKLVIIREQFQMYAKNDLLAHPLVSPVQQPSLGGLPPMLIQVGGAELLRDEQIYLAHKAANPRQYPPSEAVMDQYDPQRTILNQYPGTDVQLQVWEDLCHVPHTLSFTRPAKYMYRSVAQFGAWALARAQHKSIEILDEDAVSIISEGEDPNEYGKGSQKTFGSIGAEGVTSTQNQLTSIGAVGKAGDDLPPFKEHMIRQRINRYGTIFPLPRVSEIACLQLDHNTIGAIKTGPVRKWLAKRAEYDVKFASEFKKVQKKKLKEAKAYDKMEAGEHPPAAALVNRRTKGHVAGEKKKGKSWGLAMWSGWGSSHDESTIDREEKIKDVKESETDRPASVATSTATAVENRGGANALAAAGFGVEAPSNSSASRGKLAVPSYEADDGKRRRRSSASVLASPWGSKRNGSRTRSPYRRVKDEGQASSERDRDSVAPVSPPMSPDSSSTRGFWDISRRSSAASSKVNYARPVSTATMLPSNLNPNAKTGKTSGDDAGVPAKAGWANDGASEAEPSSPTFPTASQAPHQLDKAQGAVKVPGSENTYLNADNPRPHNGVVAYPFTLANKRTNTNNADGSTSSPNASTMTLDSVTQPQPQQQPPDSDFEMPTGFGVVTAVELPADANAGPAASPAAEAPRPLLSSQSETEIVPAMVVPQSTPMAATHIKATRTRPVSGISEDTRLSNLVAPEEDPVSPLATPGSITSNSSFKQREYRSRDSRLGQLGADGMPTQAWPEGDAAMDNAVRPTPVPFKIRNPVYDPRVASSAPAAPATQPGQAANAPFRMRHTVYDSKVAPPGSKPPVQQSEQSPNMTESPVPHSSNVTGKKPFPLANTDTMSTPASSVSRAPSPLASVAERPSKAPSSSTELSQAYTSPKQVSTNTTLDPPAPNRNNLDKTNGRATLAKPLAITPTPRPASRSSSTGPPPTPPPKDTPPASPPPTTPLPPLPPTSSGGIMRQPSNSNLIDGYPQRIRQVGAPTSKYSSENLRSVSGSRPSMQRAGNGAIRSTATVHASYSQQRQPAIDPSAAAPPEKESTPGTSVAQDTIRSRTKAAETPVSPMQNSEDQTAPLPALPTSKFSPSAISQETYESPIRNTTIDAPPPTIGDLSFEHDPVSPLESEKMERSSDRPPLETVATGNEGFDLKALTMGNKI